MARIQVLPLPPAPGDPAPFVLVIDEAGNISDITWDAMADVLTGFKDSAGARAVLVLDDTMDVV